MDYPKSVPSVGLVGGKFVDENPGAGTPGSLIPSAWGNAVTDEILAVISGGGLTPDEENNSQLFNAIKAIVNKAAPEKPFVSVSESRALLATELGVVLASASAGAITITLPQSNVALGVRDVVVRRTDNSGNRLVVQASGTDKIKFHTHLNAAGYAFTVLMGAGDFWHLRSDGAGGWWPIARYDGTSLGRPVFSTTTTFSPGGWGAHNGSLLNRAEWPWLWDHAQASGMLVTEAGRVGFEGCWTSGDGSTTFRTPEARGEFLRALDESRGVDAGRVAGSYQKGSLQTFDPDRSSYSVTGLTHTGDNTGILAKHGLDPVNTADYGSSQVVSIDNTSIAAINVAGGVVRPRNIAYPARLKLI
ncbi:tail fiber protein [Pseudomonas putida]|uniref:Phage tail protein n=1 Tax=Pseudomonas putida TaxID=303 RepID=A0A1B2F152_PSEPU|nr:tail fiber protein [Pseudomonas putida]ANY85999.1 hypothetical protein IEC33019_0395 [Pseudomonas putida]